MSTQSTIRREVAVEGIGLHSGQPARVSLSPAAPDTGVLFRVEDGTLIPARASHVVDSNFATTIGAFGVRVRVIEHLMAALGGLGIDNVIVDIRGGEVPGLDGSARPFVSLIQAAGMVRLPARRRALVIRDPVRVDDGGRWIQVLPSDTFRISYTLDNEHPAIGLQVLSLEITPETFADDIAAARTYGFLKDVGAMRQHGLALGGSLDNTVVLGTRGILNAGLRFADEFVRHKVLDLVGDLWLLGRPLQGHVVARNGGHALNARLVAALEESASIHRRRAAETASAAPVLAAAD